MSWRELLTAIVADGRSSNLPGNVAPAKCRQSSSTNYIKFFRSSMVRCRSEQRRVASRPSREPDRARWQRQFRSSSLLQHAGNVALQRLLDGIEGVEELLNAGDTSAAKCIEVRDAG